MAKQILLRLILALLVLLPMGLRASQPYPAHSFQGIAQPYLFALARWEASRLPAALLGGWHAGNPDPTPEQIELVHSYFSQGQQMGWLRSRLGQPDLSHHKREALEEELQMLEAQRSQVESKVMALLRAQVGQALAQAGLETSLLWGRIDLLFPPLSFEFEVLPHLLTDQGILQTLDNPSTIYSH